MKKKCNKCGEVKNNELFPHNRSICKECNLLWHKQYRELNIEIIAKRKKTYYIKNKQYITKQSKDHYEVNKERLLNEKKEYYKLNKESILENRKKYHENNRDKILKRMSGYQHNNLDKFRVRRHKREALQRNTGGSYTKKEWLDLCKHYEYKCLRCKQIFKKLTVDHVIPISKGGTNYITNIQPLCRKCNSIKNTKSTDYREN